MADENIDIEVTGFQSLKSQIKEAQVEYQKLLNSVNATPAAINAAAAKVGQLKETLADANDTANAFTTQGKFQAVTKSLAAVAGGFTAIQGAISLAGGDAKDFEKTFQKVQGAMALTQGLTALADMGDAFTNLKKVAVTAFQGIKAAIGSTGIGLLVIALGAIYAYWDDIKAAVTGVDEEQKKLNEDSAANLAMQEKKLTAISAQENILRLQGMSEEEIYKLKLDQYDAVIKASKANIINLEVTEKKQIEAAQRNKDILQGIIRFLTIPLTAILYTVDLVGKALGQDFGLEEKFSGGLAKLVFDPEEVKKEGDKAIEEAKTALTKLENERAGMILQHDAKRDAEQKTREDKAKAAREKEAADQKAAREKEEALQIAHLQKITDLNNKYGELMITDETERQLLTLKNSQKKQIDELQVLIDGYNKKKTLTESEQNTLATLNKEFNLLKLVQDTEYYKKAQELYKEDAKKQGENLDKISEALADSLEEKKKLEQLAAVESINELKSIEEFIDEQGNKVYYTNEIYKNGAVLRKELDEKLTKDLADIDEKYRKLKYDEDEKLLKESEDQAKLAAYQSANIILSAQESTDNQKKQAQEKLAQDLLNIEIDGARKRIEIAKDLGLDTIELEKDLAEKLNGVYKEDTKNYAEAWLEKNAVLFEQIAGGLEAATAAVNALADYQKMKNQEELEATKAKYDTEQTLLDEQYQNDINQANLTAEQKTAIQDEYANASAEIEYNRALENYNREKQGFENGKKVQYAQAVIGGIQGAIGAFSSLAPIPIVGPVLGAIAAAAVAVSTAFQLATIAKTTYSGTPPKKPTPGGAGGGGAAGGSSGSKFAQGGLLTGRKHSEGGIPTQFGQLEGGEYVVNRSATEAFMPLLDKINGMGKGSGAPNNLSVMGEQNIAASTPIIKTYVVASDMTSQQEANKRLEDIARL